jgi:hypothetical protein
MRDFFSQYGKVVDCTVSFDHVTGRSRGFGFISIEDADVQSFLGFGHLEIDGKLVSVMGHNSFSFDTQNYPFRLTSSLPHPGTSVKETVKAQVLVVVEEARAEVSITIAVACNSSSSSSHNNHNNSNNSADSTLLLPLQEVCQVLHPTLHSTLKLLRLYIHGCSRWLVVTKWVTR